MKLVATIPVRNEAWVIGLSARVALMWCDELAILNHSSTDGTVDILAELQADYPGRVHVVSMPGDVWTEMQHRECLLELARVKGATHIAIVDADEVLTGNCQVATRTEPPLYDVSAWPRDSIFQMPGYNMRGDVDRYHIDGTWGRRWFSVAFKDDPRLHWKTAGYQHHHREPRGMKLNDYKPIRQGDGGIMHLWGVTERRLVARHALYKIRDRINYPEMSAREIDQQYSQAIYGNPPRETPAGWHYAKAPASWWEPYKHLMQYLDLDAIPWQESEAQRLVQLHGCAKFEGLDLFGVV